MFRHGPDAYVFVDFMRPDVGRINRMLDETEDARYLFFVLHSPIAASDTWGPYWFLLGKPEDTDARRALFARLLKRHAIVLCGHLHVTQIRRWRRDDGELVEFCANSVWRPQEDRPSVLGTQFALFGRGCTNGNLDFSKTDLVSISNDSNNSFKGRTFITEVRFPAKFELIASSAFNASASPSSVMRLVPSHCAQTVSSVPAAAR